MQGEQDRVADDVGPAEEAVWPQARREEKCREACDPYRRGERMDENCLLKEVFAGTEDYVAVFGADIVHELKKWPMVMHVPQQIGQKNQ